MTTAILATLAMSAALGLEPPASAAQGPATTAPAAGAKSADGAAGIAAIWRQETVTWDRLRPVLAELAGSAALQEVLLDQLLEERARERGIVPDDAALAREDATLEHIQALSQGGSSHLDNLAISHARCNQQRHGSSWCSFCCCWLCCCCCCCCCKAGHP
jgi:hypothetical protein